MFIALQVKVEFHWGYWIRRPGTSKYQGVVPIPPPTTLIGALTSSLAKTSKIPVSGEVLRLHGKGIVSPAYLLEGSILASSCYLEGIAYPWDDLNRYITLHFQAKTRDSEEEKEAGGRRYLAKYRFGAIPCGKVYYPSGMMTISYIFSEEKLRNLMNNPEVELEEAAWEIQRIGSKESITTVKEVKILTELDEIQKGEEIKTKYYFPRRLGNPKSGEYYLERFWRLGWGRNLEAVFEEYLVPGTRIPVKSSEVTVEVNEKALVLEKGECILVGA